MITELIARLGAAGTEYVTIDHARTLDEAQDTLSDDIPIARFIPGPVTSEPAHTRPVRQRSTETVIVQTICKWEDRDRLVLQQKGALIGYQHSANHTELQHVKGEVLKISGKIEYWLDMYSADTWIQGS